MLITNDACAPYLTPYKHKQPVLCASGQQGAFDAQAVDIPFVFWHNEMWYMLYTGFDGMGYQSALATSQDLVHWTHLAVILNHGRTGERWDKIGAAATWILKESNDLKALPRLKKVDGKYWLVYHSYPSTGYEAGPAEISLAWCEEEDLLHWHRKETPVFSWKEGASWEAGGLYKACLFYHDDQYYLFYNAKDTQSRWVEQTGVATSSDLLHWHRCEQNPVLRVSDIGWDSRFVSDPCIFYDNGRWLNFYFGLGSGHAAEGLAFSDDLLHWEKVSQPILAPGPVGSLDEGHAHKASIVWHNGILYHFYCATRPWQEGDTSRIHNEWRTIALATSKPLEEI